MSEFNQPPDQPSNSDSTPDESSESRRFVDARFRTENLLAQMVVDLAQRGVEIEADCNEFQTKNMILEEQARIDPLTGLGNRKAFIEHYTQARSEQSRLTMTPDRLSSYLKDVSVMVIDLDGFKASNDQYGHAFGDETLRKVAKILKENVRNYDEAYRWGGDEFVIVQRGITADRATDAADAIIEEIRDRTVVTASIGIGQADFDLRPEEFINKADAALLEAKSKGKNTVVRFNGHSRAV